MNRYLVPKTGWQFLDLAKAYGLGIVVHTLSKGAIIADTGSYYEIRSKNEPDFSELPKIRGYLGEDIDEWGNVLATLSKARIKTLREDMVEFFTNEDNIEQVLRLKLNGKSVTLPQSLELGASKGIRKAVLSSYSESQVKIPAEEFYLAVLGAINISVWKGSKDYVVAVYPLPLDTRVGDVYDIKHKLKKSVKGFHRAGYFSTVARIAVRLVKEEKELMRGGSFLPKIGGILYGVMMRTGNQPKPFTSGLFPLDFLHSLIGTLEGEEAIDKWIEILDRTSYIKGYEDIAMALSKFIAEPTLENYYSYIRLHLRNELRSNSIKFGSYDADSLLEVLKNVEVS
ncbi:hypothetical protein [Thermococcus aciditolerans]|uniref:CRISPR-associated protein n=1 Tax=Thermococcus aciditolerans TaxID=2598455 RepID=A0A5C0SL61_9EURY|nr:hypothetical protein [Thermococcus aciditolerans]QEK14507.1 hypothetical protein FPV09_04640 [Thermococcus aciditolerans]